MARVELIQPPKRIDERVLDEILRVERAARSRRQSSSSPSPQRRQTTREQSIERFAIALPYKDEQLLSGFEWVSGSPWIRHEYQY
jgi:hypothetical protein